MKSQISLKSMMKTMGKEDQGLLSELNSLHGGVRARNSLDYGIIGECTGADSKGFAQYEAVFLPLVGLPPSRSHDHIIELKEGAGPINVRPYRYPQFQNDEIEHLVREMLLAGMI